MRPISDSTVLLLISISIFAPGTSSVTKTDIDGAICQPMTKCSQARMAENAKAIDLRDGNSEPSISSPYRRSNPESLSQIDFWAGRDVNGGDAEEVRSVKDDSDGDGIPDDVDNCPLIPNPSQADSDSDGIGESCDNCLSAPNPDQANADGDAVGNACDDDDDNDGDFDVVDNCPLDYDPTQQDSDGDGIGNVCDNCPGFNPGQEDNEGDGLGDPCDGDDDNDGDYDVLDNCPFDYNPGQGDADQNGIGDACCCVGTTGNVNLAGIVDLSDLSALVSFLTGGGYVLPCPDEANVNAAGIVDLSDLSSLVSYLTGGGYLLPNCP